MGTPLASSPVGSRQTSPDFWAFIHLTDVVTWHLKRSSCQSDNLMDKATSEQDSNRSISSGGKFAKGKSGNPGGRPAITSEVRELARHSAPKAFERIVKLMDDKNPRIALAAANTVLDRAYGKPSPEERTASFTMKPVTSAIDLVEAMSDLLKATTNGEVSITEAKELASIMEAQRKAIETTDLETRLKELEARLI